MGILWSDILYILFITSLQVSIIPSLLPFFAVDLLTPWLVFNFIALGTSHGFILAILSSMALESHSTISAGIYFCTYGIIGTIICMVKKHISWQNFMPWSTTFLLSQFWVILFETIVFLVKTGNALFFNLSYGMNALFRMLSTFVFGLLLFQNASSLIIEETPRESAL